MIHDSREHSALALTNTRCHCAQQDVLMTTDSTLNTNGDGYLPPPGMPQPTFWQARGTLGWDCSRSLTCASPQTAEFPVLTAAIGHGAACFPGLEWDGYTHTLNDVTEGLNSFSYQTATGIAALTMRPLLARTLDDSLAPEDATERLTSLQARLRRNTYQPAPASIHTEAHLLPYGPLTQTALRRSRPGNGFRIACEPTSQLNRSLDDQTVATAVSLVVGAWTAGFWSNPGNGASVTNYGLSYALDFLGSAISDKSPWVLVGTLQGPTSSESCRRLIDDLISTTGLTGGNRTATLIRELCQPLIDPCNMPERTGWVVDPMYRVIVESAICRAFAEHRDVTLNMLRSDRWLAVCSESVEACQLRFNEIRTVLNAAGLGMSPHHFRIANPITGEVVDLDGALHPEERPTFYGLELSVVEAYGTTCLQLDVPDVALWQLVMRLGETHPNRDIISSEFPQLGQESPRVLLRWMRHFAPAIQDAQVAGFLDLILTREGLDPAVVDQRTRRLRAAGWETAGPLGATLLGSAAASAVPLRDLSHQWAQRIEAAQKAGRMDLQGPKQLAPAIADESAVVA